MPAILKGRIDRVFALGRARMLGKILQQGDVYGKRAMCSLIIEPFVVYAPARMTTEERQAYLARYDERSLPLRTTPTLKTLDIAGYEGLGRKA